MGNLSVFSQGRRSDIDMDVVILIGVHFYYFLKLSIVLYSDNSISPLILQK